MDVSDIQFADEPESGLTRIESLADVLSSAPIDELPQDSVHGVAEQIHALAVELIAAKPLPSPIQHDDEIQAHTNIDDAIYL